jgi:predicted RND superfamily exporter protein
MGKAIIIGAAKTVGALALIVLIFAPFTNLGVLLMAGSLIVVLVCLMIVTGLDDIPRGRDDGQDAGKWPPKIT